MDKNLIMKAVKAGLVLAREGVVIGPGGNISVRTGSIMYIKKSGSCMEDGKLSDYVGVDLKTGKVNCKNGRPSCETPMHAACYLERPEVKCVIHSHGPFSIAYSMQKKPLRAFFPDQLTVLGSSIPVLPFMYPGSEDVAEKVGAAIKKYNGVFIRNHGLLTVGVNVDEAFYRTVVIEMAIKTMHIAKSFGGVKYFTAKQMKLMDASDEGVYRRSVLKGRS